MDRTLNLGSGIMQSEKNIRIKKGKQPTVRRPNTVLIKHAVMILMEITEKQVSMPVKKRNHSEPSE